MGSNRETGAAGQPRKPRRSITGMLFGFVVLMAAVFILLFGIIYTTNYDRYVAYRRQRSLEEAFARLCQEYEGDALGGYELFQQLEMRYDMRLHISSGDGRIKYSSLLFSTRTPPLFASRNAVFSAMQLAEQLPRMFGDRLYGKVNSVSESDNYLVYTIGERALHVEFISLIGAHPSGDILLLQVPTPMVGSSRKATSFFLLLAAGGSLTVTLVFAYLAGKRASKPILEIAHVANRMADLDFSLRYTGESETEVGRLGDSVNRLSEHLEATITQLRQSNALLEEEIAHARQLDDMRKNLLVNVSHELKTPLSLIMGYAEGLRINLHTDEESRTFYSGVIEDEARHMARLVGDLLSVSRIESGATHLDLEAFPMDELVQEVCARFAPAVRERGLRFACDPCAATVLADRAMVDQVLANYLSNAVDHAVGGSVVQVNCAAHGDFLRLSVHNEGPAIDEQELPRIWQSFYKLDKARTRALGGTGIGLSIVKAILEAHGGAYGACNTEGGVTFWCEFPLAAQEGECEAIGQAD